MGWLQGILSPAKETAKNDDAGDLFVAEELMTVANTRLSIPPRVW